MKAVIPVSLTFKDQKGFCSAVPPARDGASIEYEWRELVTEGRTMDEQLVKKSM